jgi:hypothetical protein
METLPATPTLEATLMAAGEILGMTEGECVQ